MTIFEEILSLLSGSPELHAYLLARPEQLQTTDYADIITGAPIALTEKGRLLERLSEHMTHSEDAGLIRDYSACLHMALQALESKDAAFSAELWKDGEQLDGPYIAFSMEEARRAIAQYRKRWEENADDEIAAYWRIEQYRQGGASDRNGFARPEYTFAAAPNGEVQYYMHDPQKRRCVCGGRFRRKLCPFESAGTVSPRRHSGSQLRPLCFGAALLYSDRGGRRLLRRAVLVSRRKRAHRIRGAEARALFLQLLLRIAVYFAAVWNQGLRGRAAQRMRIYGASVRKAP